MAKNNKGKNNNEEREMREFTKGLFVEDNNSNDSGSFNVTKKSKAKNKKNERTKKYLKNPKDGRLLFTEESDIRDYERLQAKNNNEESVTDDANTTNAKSNNKKSKDTKKESDSLDSKLDNILSLEEKVAKLNKMHKGEDKKAEKIDKSKIVEVDFTIEKEAKNAEESKETKKKETNDISRVRKVVDPKSGLYSIINDGTNKNLSDTFVRASEPEETSTYRIQNSDKNKLNLRDYVVTNVNKTTRVKSSNTTESKAVNHHVTFVSDSESLVKIDNETEERVIKSIFREIDKTITIANLNKNVKVSLVEKIKNILPKTNSETFLNWIKIIKNIAKIIEKTITGDNLLKELSTLLLAITQGSLQYMNGEQITHLYKKSASFKSSEKEFSNYVYTDILKETKSCSSIMIDDICNNLKVL